MSIFRISIFLTLLSALLLGGHIYLYRRLVRDLATTRRGHLLGSALLALGAGLIFARLSALTVHSYLPAPLPILAASWTGFALYAVIALGAADLASRWAHRGSPAKLEAESEPRRRFLTLGATGSALAAAGTLGSYGLWRAFHAPEVTSLGVRLPQLPKPLDGLRIVQISDIHLGDVLHAKFVRELVERCNALRPDLVAVTGDLVDGSVAQLGSAVAELRGLKSRFGTYFCMGNHEYYSGDLDWELALPRMGITVLRNRRVSIGDAQASFDLIGVDDWSRRRFPRGRYDLAKAVAGRRPDRASVLLAHQPRGFPDAVAAALGLQLSGHTHGGQLFPFTAIVGLVQPFTAGHFSREGSQLYVNRGAGFWGPSMRVGSPPEITAVTLMA